MQKKSIYLILGDEYPNEILTAFVPCFFLSSKVFEFRDQDQRPISVEFFKVPLQSITFWIE